jgi:hypothetical protein
MKRLLLLAALMNCGLAFGYAELGEEATETQSAAVQGEEQQVVLVEAWRRDRAMDAFLRGDFATAEIEFRKNVQCIRRSELQLDYSLQQGANGMGRAILPGANAAPNIHNLQLRPDEIRERTCFSKEWQLYMIGLTQIQLGHFAEAKKTLYRVTQMSKEDLLFDAHYRVGLLELLDGDIESANRRLVHLTSMRRSCRARGDRCEVNSDLEVATAYLARAVADARHGVVR